MALLLVGVGGRDAGVVVGVIDVVVRPLVGRRSRHLTGRGSKLIVADYGLIELVMLARYLGRGVCPIGRVISGRRRCGRGDRVGDDIGGLRRRVGCRLYMSSVGSDLGIDDWLLDRGWIRSIAEQAEPCGFEITKVGG